MGRTSITETNRSSDQPDQFPRLKLKTGEVARVLVPDDENAWMEWVHSMRAPIIGDDGAAVMTTKKRKNGDLYEDYDYGFVGQRICLGDSSVVEDKGVDPARCPACQAAADGIQDMTPVRRFAVPIIRYKAMKPSAAAPLQNPPSAEILVWGLTQRMYNKLLDVKPEIQDLLEIPDGQSFHLRAADIVIECEDGDWQRLNFRAPLRPAHANAKVGELVRELWGNAENRPTDEQLQAACGRAGDRAYMVIDVDDVRNRWRKAEGGGASDPTGGGSLTEGLDQLADDLLGPATDPLADHPGGTAEFAKPEDRAAVAAAEAADPFAEAPAPAAPARQAPDDLFGDAPAPAPAPAAANGSAAKVQSFDDILGG
jgi:hypothetical protein